MSKTKVVIIVISDVVLAMVARLLDLPDPP
jgi:hypothetical protein